MTPSEEKTAEERARTIDGAIQRVEDHLNGSGNFDLVEAMSVLEHEVKDELSSLRLTNQRLEAEVERMRDSYEGAERRIKELRIALNECCRMFAWCDDKYGELINTKASYDRTQAD